MTYAEMIRNETYIGNENYWISWQNGTHHVMKAVDKSEDWRGFKEVFTGWLEDCEQYLKELEAKYQEAMLF